MFTGDLMSPWVATTLPSITPTLTLQPVPQKRQAALSHLSLVISELVIKFDATAGTETPATAAAAAIAFALINSRRLIVSGSPSFCSSCIIVMFDVFYFLTVIRDYIASLVTSLSSNT